MRYPEAKRLTKEEAIALVGGEREIIHCFMNPAGGMLVGADWEWAEFIREMDRAEIICEAGEEARRMKHPLALVVNDRFRFFERTE